jgi:hypothetical protein
VALVWLAGCVTIALTLMLLHLAQQLLVQTAKLGLISLDGSHSPDVPPLRAARTESARSGATR